MYVCMCLRAAFFILSAILLEMLLRRRQSLYKFYKNFISKGTHAAKHTSQNALLKLAKSSLFSAEYICPSPI